MKTDSYQSILQEAYNELKCNFDGSPTKEYEYDDCIFYLKRGIDNEVIKYYHTKGYKNFDNITIPPDEVYKLEQEYVRDKRFSILIDNSDRRGNGFIRYHEEYFETKEEARNKIFEIMKCTKKINVLHFYYCNEGQFCIMFDEKNRIKRVTASAYFKPNEFVGGLDAKCYNFDTFVTSDEILLEEKSDFLFKWRENEI